MRKQLIIILLLFNSFSLFAQTYGNEWINYGQTYYKIPVTKEGIYRITYQALDNVGFPFSSMSPKSIQIFYRGQEQYIYIQGENDEIFNPADFIEFYAKGNDGWLDSALFEPATVITNPYYSMYTDTAYYFLTWDITKFGLRVTVETDINFTAPSSPLATHCMVDVLYQNPQYYYSAGNGPRYLLGEGWFEYFFLIGTTIIKPLVTPGYVSGITPSTINVSVATNSSLSHHLNVSLGSAVFFDTIFSGYTAVKKTYSTSVSLSPTTDVSFSSINDIDAVTDNMEVAYILLTYPRNFVFTGLYQKNFRLPDSNGNKSLLEISQFGSTNAVLWDITNYRRIPVVYDSGKLKAIVPNGGNEKICYISSTDSIFQVNSLQMKTYTNYLTNGFNSDYIIITHPLLFTGATAYRDYRNTTGFHAYCYDVEQLYDQFAYGIKKHPLAIKNFLKYITTHYDTLPKFVFLIGKNIHSGTWSYGENFRKNTANFASALVPSYGSPSSDNFLTTKILTNNETQDIPIGRIAATTNDEVAMYLSKVMEHEGILQPAEWMKHIIHFGGGSNTAQQNTFAGYLNEFAVIISDTLFGGFVNTFLKNSSLPIQITIADTITNIINNGVSIINFFGHSYADGFDMNIDEPDNYLNRGKYPLLIANSCLLGDIHLPAPKKLSERWIFTSQKGAIGFIANVDLGYDWYLYLYTKELYKQFTYKNYMQPIGKCMCDGSQKIINDNGSVLINTCLEFTLHGDPAVRLKCFPLPDLTINTSSISFVPGIVTTESDSCYIKIIITNIGKAINDPFLVNVTRTFPNGSTENYFKSVYGCHFKDTVYVKVPVDFVNGPGINHFCVFVDSQDSIAEISETNNSACTDIIIRSNDLIPIYPYEYAIYPNNTVTLMASTGYPFIGTQTYIFEIDTNDIFASNSPSKVTGYVTHSGGVVPWSPSLTLTDSRVYFWRVSPVPQGSANYNWRESSFIYITGKTGWSQAHFFQYKKDGFENIIYNRPNRKFDFVTAPVELWCHDIGSANNDEEYMSIRYYLGAITDHTSYGPYPAILVVVIDPTSITPWKSDHGNYGQANYSIGPNKYFVFYAPSLLDNLATFLNTYVPDSFYVLAYTFISGKFNSWTETAKAAFDNLGPNNIRNLSDDVPNGDNIPYIFFAKKGDTSTAQEMYGATPDDTLDFHTQIPTNFTYGQVHSTLIGPSTSWKTLHWRQISLENPAKDSVYIKTMAYKPNNDSTLIIPYLYPPNYDVNDLYNYADATQFPYLRLSMFTDDDSLKTPSQLTRWQVTYDGAPETAINPSKGQFFYDDTLQEGDNLIFSVATENISRYNMDSLLVRYWVQDRNNQFIDKGYRKLRPHPAGDVLTDTISFNTTGYGGLNHIWYEVNPIDTNTGTYAQLEQYHFNNYAEKPFYVISDITNPLLDVTFDGVHIMNGDIVSAKPYILTTLKDENKFLALNDTSLFGVYLTNKSTETEVESRIYFNNPCIQYTLAQLPKNSFKIEYRPILADGKYQLCIQAKDVSNNESGDIDYRITFEVINKATITNVFNYPNPFSTSTRFVFTLTGSEIPDDFRIQIITITGKFVREIGLDELGLIHIGPNLTQYAWDGTDMYGDKLANGIYFFKVIARLNNETIEHRATDADKFFKEGFGKMYILR